MKTIYLVCICALLYTTTTLNAHTKTFFDTSTYQTTLTETWSTVKHQRHSASEDNAELCWLLENKEAIVYNSLEPLVLVTRNGRTPSKSVNGLIRFHTNNVSQHVVISKGHPLDRHLIGSKSTHF